MLEYQLIKDKWEEIDGVAVNGAKNTENLPQTKTYQAHCGFSSLVEVFKLQHTISPRPQSGNIEFSADLEPELSKNLFQFLHHAIEPDNTPVRMGAIRSLGKRSPQAAILGQRLFERHTRT